MTTVRAATAPTTAEQEARYHQLLEAAYDGICTTDVAGAITYANPRLESMCGVPAGGLLGRPYFDLLDADEVEAARARFAALAARGADSRELVLRRADGTPLHVLKATTALLDAGGAVQGALLVLSDLTGRRRAEASLRTSEARLAGIIGSAMDAILTTDAAQVIVLANAAAERVFGYAPGAMVGLPLATLIPPRFRGAHDAHVRRFEGDGTTTRAMGRPAALTHEGLSGIRRDGTEFPIEASISQVATDDGRFFTVILRDVTQQRAAQAERETALEALRLSEERYALAARAARLAIWDWDFARAVVGWNGGVTDVFGYPAEAVRPDADWWWERIHPDDRARVLAGIDACVADASGDDSWQDRYRFLRADGQYAEVLGRSYILRARDRRPLRMVGALEDLTATLELEERLRQAQKMEAVGQLAGGVAHDFNNLLTVIIGNLEFLQRDLAAVLPADHVSLEDLAQIGEAGERARVLVRQLLTFSRRQPVHARRVTLGEVVLGAEKLLRRVIGEEIMLEVHTDDAAHRVEADPGQVEQVLMNLAVNARDAMLTPLHGHAGRGGSLALEVDVVALTPTEARLWDGAAAGRWVRLRVRDTGHGMDAVTRARVFEPFFTTKPPGAGTGLGLATVFGIVRQAGGAIRVDSAAGEGTTFTILLPALDPLGEETEPRPHLASGARAATVLLVEDETPVRVTARRMLERHGHTVLEARHGGDALLLWRERRGMVDVVITDFRMPELGGQELLAALRAERPDLPAVLMSGYAEEWRRPEIAAGSGAEAFLTKPFTGEALRAAVDAVLGPPD